MANQEQSMTFEQIEAHVKSADLTQYDKPQAVGVAGAQADLTSQLQKICGIYKIVRPIIQGILGIPLIPESLKKPLRVFVSVMDAICP
jgi:hypothetical protein